MGRSSYKNQILGRQTHKHLQANSIRFSHNRLSNVHPYYWLLV